MPAGIKYWSTTAASNNSAVPYGAPEGWFPSDVNNWGRQVMADVRSWYQDAEWIDFGHTPTRTGATTFTVTGDQTAIYATGRAIKCTDSSTLYGKIVSSVFGAVTTVTVVLNSGSLSTSLSAVAVATVSSTVSLPSTIKTDTLLSARNTAGGEVLNIVDAGATDATDAIMFIGFKYSTTLGGSETRVSYLGHASAGDQVLTLANELASANIVYSVNSGTHVFEGGDIQHRTGTGSGTQTLVGITSNNIGSAVGNVGTGTDDLLTYTLPANSLSSGNKGVRITAWGRTANNVNAKTLALLFGGSTVVTRSMTTSAANTWQIQALILRTGSNAQGYVVTSFTDGTTNVGASRGTLAITDTASIIIKCTGAATADNDIIQDGMLIEFIN